jgi:hypothetical protein
MQYVDSAVMQGPINLYTASSPCDSTFDPYSYTFTWDVGDFCRFVQTNDGWLLHRNDGARLYRNDGHGWQYAGNPGSMGYRQFSVDRTRQALVGDATHRPLGFDGVFLDDIGGWRNPALGNMDNANHTILEYGTDAPWQSALAGYLDALRVETTRDGKRLAANLEGGASASPYLDHVDDYLVENFAASWDTSYSTQAEIEASWPRIERDDAAGRNVILVGQGNSRTDVARMRFALAAYLMVAAPHVTFRFQNAAGYRAFWDYPEFTMPIGAPTSMRYRVSSSVWRRDFQRGYVTVDLVAHVGTMTML